MLKQRQRINLEAFSDVFSQLGQNSNNKNLMKSTNYSSRKFLSHGVNPASPQNISVASPSMNSDVRGGSSIMPAHPGGFPKLKMNRRNKFN